MAIRYALTRIGQLGLWLAHGFVELDNNTAERVIRPLALGRKNWLFAGSERGGRSAAIAYTLIETARLNDVDAEAWLSHVLEVIADYPAREINALLPWNCRTAPADHKAVT